MSALFWIDGALVPAERACIAPDDLGFTVGLAVFETLLWEDRRLGFVARHLERFEAGARALAIAWPPPWDPRAALAAYTAACGDEPRAVRATLTRGRPPSAELAGGRPSLVIGSRPVEFAPVEGVVLEPSTRALVPERECEPTSRDTLSASRIKSTNRIDYALAREEARAAGAWDALLPTTEGDFAEASVANLFAVVDGALVTPPLQRGCLPGVMRALVLEALGRDRQALAGLVERVAEERLERPALARADEVFLTNTTGRVVGVREVRGVGRYPVPGPVQQAVRALLAEVERRDRIDTAR